jgi:hypothetical protein
MERRLALVGVVIAVVLVLVMLSFPRVPVAPGDTTTTGPVLPPPASGAGQLPIDPSDCEQGSDVIDVPPLGLGVNESALFLSDYAQLGATGGGTLYLEPGYYQFNETLKLDSFNNVSIQGSGVGSTILTVPPDPVQNFHSDNGTPVGLFNATNGSQSGSPVDLIVTGPGATNNFEMCDLSLDAQVSGNNETWVGSLVFDNGGGVHHVYSDVGEEGFWGPSGTPNGIHLNGLTHPAFGYIVDNLTSTNYTTGYKAYHGVAHGGPDFLDTGDIANSSIENVTGIGNFEIELAPDVGCVFANISVSGHGLIDPGTGAANPAYGIPNGSWGGTVFERVSFDTQSTPAPNALGVSLANGSSSGASDFYGMYWFDDRFVGTVVDAVNMGDVQNSSFFGTIDSLPPIFVNNSVMWNVTIPSRELAELPIEVDGWPTGGSLSTLENDVFVFPASTFRYGNEGLLADPFKLNVPIDVWYKITLKIGGETPGGVFEAPGISLSRAASLTHLVYDSLGDGAPATLNLLDAQNSTNFSDQGATVSHTTAIVDNLP